MQTQNAPSVDHSSTMLVVLTMVIDPAFLQNVLISAAEKKSTGLPRDSRVLVTLVVIAAMSSAAFLR